MAKSRFRSAAGYSEEMKQRTEEQSGGNYISVFKDGSNLPMWKDTEGDHALDIIPYLASKNHPHHAAGKHVYKVELWVHKRVGPEKGDYICLRNYGEDCPLCEAKSEEMEKPSPRKKIVDSLKGSQRCFYNVVVYTNNQEEKGVQIWEASSYLAENPFRDVAKNKRTGERIAYADPDKGKTVTFTITGKGTGKKLSGIVFEDRPAPIDDEILDEAYTIEDYLVKPSYEELAKIGKIILSGVLDNDEDSEPEPPKRRRDADPPPHDDEDAPPPRKRREPEPEPQEEEAPPRRRMREPEPEPEQEDAPPPRRRREPEPEPEPAPDEPPPTRRMRRRD